MPISSRLSAVVWREKESLPNSSTSVVRLEMVERKGSESTLGNRHGQGIMISIPDSTKSDPIMAI